MEIDSLKTVLLWEPLESFVVCVPGLKTSLGKIAVAQRPELLNLKKLILQGIYSLKISFISNLAVSREQWRSLLLSCPKDVESFTWRYLNDG